MEDEYFLDDMHGCPHGPDEDSAEYCEPDIDDTVHCCPDCERPNQFGEMCFSCAQERGEQPY